MPRCFFFHLSNYIYIHDMSILFVHPQTLEIFLACLLLLNDPSLCYLLLLGINQYIQQD